MAMTETSNRQGPSPLRQALGILFRSAKNVELRILAVLACAVLALELFLEVADDVREGETQRFDEWILSALRNPADPSDPIGPAWIERAALDLTSLGSFAVLFLTVTMVAGYLVIARKFHLLR